MITRGTCRRPESARAAVRLERSRKQRNESRRAAVSCWGLSCLRSNPNSPQWLGAEHASPCRRVRLRCSWRSPRPESAPATRCSCPRSPPCRPRRRSPRSARSRVRSTSTRRRRASPPARSTPARTPRTRAVIVVHLYGYPAELPDTDLLDRSRMLPRRTERCAIPAGPAATAYSFYPTKNLGGIGDGGAVVTDDGRSRRARSARLRVHGMTASTCTRTSRRTSACRRSRRHGCGSGSRTRPPTSTAARDRRAATGEAAPHLRWQADHPDARLPSRRVPQSPIARRCTRRTRSGRRRDGGPLPVGDHPAAGVPRPARTPRVPRPRPGRPSASACHAFRK